MVNEYFILQQEYVLLHSRFLAAGYDIGLIGLTYSVWLKHTVILG